MGLLTKSILILLIAVSTPLLYRQFATDDTIKFMSSYYSNFKVIDKYLRQSANYLEQGKEYIPDSKELQTIYQKLNKQFKQFINPAQTGKRDASKTPIDNSGGRSEEIKSGSEAKVYRQTNCPGDKFQVRLWSKDELKKYDGNSGESDVFVAFLGVVYNVTINAQHYGSGAEYNVFAGRDATRAFVTGNFTHDLHDYISDIDENMYSHLEAWASFYSSSYQSMGRVEGRFFDSQGCATSELNRVYDVLNKLAQNKASEQDQMKQLPDCNSEWNGDLKQGRVWCSPQSGGIERDWSGVPRIHGDGNSKKCVCLNLEASDADLFSQNLALYPGCDAKSSECTLSDL